MQALSVNWTQLRSVIGWQKSNEFMSLPVCCSMCLTGLEILTGWLIKSDKQTYLSPIKLSDFLRLTDWKSLLAIKVWLTKFYWLFKFDWLDWLTDEVWLADQVWLTDWLKSDTKNHLLTLLLTGEVNSDPNCPIKFSVQKWDWLEERIPMMYHAWV